MHSLELKNESSKKLSYSSKNNSFCDLVIGGISELGA